MDNLQPGHAGRGLIEGPAGELELMVEIPRQEMRGVAVVAHPHPLYGGTLDNKVAYMLARGALDAGLAAHRFNFRGVGHSAGAHAHGPGEVEDLLRVVEWARAGFVDQPLLLAGFSFGSLIALQGCARARASAVLTVAPPLRMAEASEVPDPQAPWWMIHGDADEVVDCDDSVALAKAAKHPPERLEIAPGVGHFFHGELLQVRQFAREFFAAHAAAP